MKKIAWVCNVQLSQKKELYTASWIEAAYRFITEEKKIELVFISTSPMVKDITEVRINKFLSVYEIPLRSKKNWKVSKKTTDDIYYLIEKLKPDLFQIFGTEFAVGLSAVYAAQKADILGQTVIWLQGLCSIIGREYCTGLPINAIARFSFRDFVRMDNIFFQQRNFLKRGKNEQTMLSIAHNVIGRTDWDKACTQIMAPNATYYCCNDTLRSDFYTKTWEYDRCNKYRIFVSQGDYPIKGLHVLLKAMPEILKKYPDAKVYVSGDNPLDKSTFRARVSRSSYALYLKKIIEIYELYDKVVFIGRLNAEDMVEQYLQANIFVLPSIMENSPNSLGEAMLLGLPCVSADVGGVSTMIKHGEEGYLYDKKEEYMLAYYVMKVFEDSKNAATIGMAAQKHARDTHDRKKNLEQLMNIYSLMMLKEKE